MKRDYYSPFDALIDSIKALNMAMVPTIPEVQPRYQKKEELFDSLIEKWS